MCPAELTAQERPEATLEFHAAKSIVQTDEVEAQCTVARGWRISDLCTPATKQFVPLRFQDSWSDSPSNWKLAVRGPGPCYAAIDPVVVQRKTASQQSKMPLAQ